ncbi:CRISPR-associated helicase Cas3 [Escherichia coli]|nr:CRISPR-associated helicase Cas3 [Escherichia coli]
MEPFKYICHYWGKSSKSLTKGNDIHLLIYHCLDVAAVADCWWDQSVVLQNTFCRNEMLSKQRVKAWLLFFIALHDIGKFDIRFQYKSAESWLKLNPATPSLNGPSTQMCRKLIMVQPVCIGLTRIHFQSNLSGIFSVFLMPLLILMSPGFHG